MTPFSKGVSHAVLLPYFRYSKCNMNKTNKLCMCSDKINDEMYAEAGYHTNLLDRDDKTYTK